MCMNYKKYSCLPYFRRSTGGTTPEAACLRPHMDHVMMAPSLTTRVSLLSAYLKTTHGPCDDGPSLTTRVSLLSAYLSPHMDHVMMAPSLTTRVSLLSAYLRPHMDHVMMAPSLTTRVSLLSAYLRPHMDHMMMAPSLTTRVSHITIQMLYNFNCYKVFSCMYLKHSLEEVKGGYLRNIFLRKLHF